MKKLLLCITIILCVCTYGWTAGVPFTGSIDAEDVDYPNTKSISGNPTNVKTAIDGLKTEIGNISAGTLADIDDLPGDAVDDDKIDSSLINNAAADGSTKGVCTFNASHFSAASGVISLNTTLDLSGFTITFGLEASDIPDISGTYATAGHDHTGTYEPADATIMKTGSYANLTAINAVPPSSGYLRYNGSAFVYDTPSGTEHDAVTLGADADTILGLSTQQITLDTQTANYVFAGPATGEAADPTFRALVADDIPDLSGTYQTADAVLAALAALENGSGVLTNDGSGNLSWGAGGGSMVYPGAGVPVSTGSAWGTSLTVGTGASNLVQLDESGKLPAVDGSSLTGLFDPASPGAIGGTTPAAATFTTLSAGATGFSVDADGDVTAKSLSITRVTGQASYSEYFEVPANGDNKVTVKPADSLAADYTVTLPSATGTLQLAGAEVDLPSSDADPDTTGEIRHDSTITGLLRGALKWFDGTRARILVDLDTAPSDDNYVVSYDANANKFYMKADATSAGGDQLVDIVTTAPLLVNGGANVNDVLPGSDADITFSVQDASTSQKGVAQFSSDNFAASNGTITVKDDGIAAAEIADLYGFELIPIAWAADGTSAPDALNDTGRKPWKYRTFASDADEDVNFVWQIPSDATVGASANNFWYRVHYLVTAATGPTASEGVAFSLAGASMGDNDATNAAKGSAVTITDDELNAAQWDYMVTDWSSAVTITNAAAGEMAELNLERTTGDDVDDYGQDVGVAFIEIRYVKNPTR